MDRLLSPLGGMLLMVVYFTAYSVTMTFYGYGGYISEEATFLCYLGFPLQLAWWVNLDRRQRRYPVPFEFDAFVFFGWPLVVPYYLFRTRGWFAVPLCLAFASAYLLPFLAALVTYAIVWR